MQTITAVSLDAKCKHILLEIGFPAHRAGYKQLCCGIPRFAQNYQQGLLTELYPYIAKTLNYTDGRAVEKAIRTVIVFTWKNGNTDAWKKYFPSCKTAPSNKRFIATIAEHLL